MRILGCISFVATVGLLGGCDSGTPEDLGLPQTKDISELKQAPKTDMSKAELEEARRRAGFKSPSERQAEALAVYVASEKSYVKGRLKGFRRLTTDLRGMLTEIEKEAPKWTKARDPDAAFAKFRTKYGKRTKKFNDDYEKLTEEHSRGGDTTAELDKAVRDWQNLNDDLGPGISEADAFAAALSAIRTQLDVVDQAIDAIEKDDSIEAED